METRTSWLQVRLPLRWLRLNWTLARRTPLAILTHVLFDFFGTLVACSESRVEQGFQRSYEVLVTGRDSGGLLRFPLSGGLARSEKVGAGARHSLDEYSMNNVY